MQLLNRQIAAVNFAKLKSRFIGVYAGAVTAVPGLPLSPSLQMPMMRSGSGSAAEKSKPAVCVKLSWLIETLKMAYKEFNNGQFNQSNNLFKSILFAIPLVVPESRSEADEVKELVHIAREYVTAGRMKLSITNDTDPVRKVELWAYMTHCNLQPAHLLVVLKFAMLQAFKIKNYITAAGFAQRLLELPDASSEKNHDSKMKAQKVVQKSEMMARNDHELQYDERNPFDIDCADFVPKYRGTPVVKCAYCQSAFAPIMAKSLCPTCNVSLIGVETIGLLGYRPTSK